jgi:hypothetical protein
VLHVWECTGKFDTPSAVKRSRLVSDARFSFSLATVSSGAILSSLGASKCVMADYCCRITFTFCRLFWQSYGTMTATVLIVLHSGMHSWDQLGFLLYGRSVYRFWQNNQNISERIFTKRMRYGSLFLIRVSQFRLKIFVSPPLGPWVLDYNPDETFNGSNTRRHGLVDSARLRSRRLPGLGPGTWLKLFIPSFSILGIHIDSTLNRPWRLSWHFPFHYHFFQCHHISV